MCFYCGKVSLHSCPVTSLGVPIQQLQKECLRLLWLLENKLVFNKQESLKLSSCQDWEWHSKSPASSLKTEQHSLWWRVARGYSRIHLITTQEHRLTSSYSHTSERLWEIANNAQMNNFFLYMERNFEQNWLSNEHVKSSTTFCGKDTKPFWELLSVHFNMSAIKSHHNPICIMSSLLNANNYKY